MLFLWKDHATCLGNVPRRRKKEEVKITFQKNREEMLKDKEQRNGISLMLRKVLLKPKEEVERPMQRNKYLQNNLQD
jgi:hypothetical protein